MSTKQHQKEVYSIAHTARCKLQMAADHPDRNLRFILGHAFTLDKIRLRIAEIEDEIDDEEASEEFHPSKERRVSFRGHSARPPTPSDRRRSPPPDQLAQLSDTDSDSGEEDDEEDSGLSLQRFESGAARPPRMIDDDSSSDEEENEPKSPPPLSDEELTLLTGGPGDKDLASAYQHIAGCPCHGEQPPVVTQMWEIPQKLGEEGPRRAVVRVEEA